MKSIFMFILLSLVGASEAAATGSADRKLDRLESKVAALRREDATKARDLSAAMRALRQAKAAVADAERAKADYERTLPLDRGRSPAEEDRLSDLKKSLAKSRDLLADAELAVRELTDSREQLKSDIEAKEEAIDRAEAKQNKPANADCPDGNCGGLKKGPPAQAAKSGLEIMPDIIKAITPLGIGAMNTYLGSKAIDQQSSDYRYYNDNNTTLGLPSTAPSSYGSVLSSATAFNSLLGSSFGGTLGGGIGGVGFGLGGFGGGIGGFLGGFGGFGGSTGGFGMLGMGGINLGGINYGAVGAGYSLGYPSYGYSYSSGMPNYGYSYSSGIPSYGYSSGYAGGTYYGATSTPYGLGGANYGYSTSWDSSVFSAAQQRAQYQQSIYSADALAAQQSLSGAYSSYNQVMQSVAGIGNTNYGSYLNYGSARYGYGSGYGYSYGTSTPALTASRQ